MTDTFLGSKIDIPDEGLKLNASGTQTHQFVVNAPDHIFQRFFIMDTGTIIVEESGQGLHCYRSNRPLKVVDGEINV
ncbi:hypothetical protein ACW9VW_08505 [Lactiplantibacillus plantarum]